jgi:hypothetical protein
MVGPFIAGKFAVGQLRRIDFVLALVTTSSDSRASAAAVACGWTWENCCNCGQLRPIDAELKLSTNG